jgi:hypothetical protein
MIEELDIVCGLDGAFTMCPYLYTYLEDVERHCEEIEVLRED